MEDLTINSITYSQVCTKCGERKHLKDFPRKLDYYHHLCKPCKQAKDREIRKFKLNRKK